MGALKMTGLQLPLAKKVSQLLQSPVSKNWSVVNVQLVGDLSQFFSSSFLIQVEQNSIIVLAPFTAHYRCRPKEISHLGAWNTNTGLPYLESRHATAACDPAARSRAWLSILSHTAPSMGAILTWS